MISRLMVSAAALAVAAGNLVPQAAMAVPAVFFNDNLNLGRQRFLDVVSAADTAFNAANPGSSRASTIFELDILNNSTNTNGVFTVTNGTTTVWVRTVRQGSPVRNSSIGESNGDGFTNWSNIYNSSSFANAEALGYTLNFFADAALTTPFQLNALGIHTNDWGTCCNSQNPTPDGSRVNASQVYLRFQDASGSNDLLLLGGIAQTIGSREHFIGAINDTNFFDQVRVIANGNGEFFGVGGRILFTTVAINSVPAGLSDVSGQNLIPPTQPPATVVPRLNWDGAGPAADGIVQGGTGTWTATTTNFTESNGATNGVYGPAPGVVVFGTTGGTVTASNSAGALAVAGMTFTVGGYTIAGDPIALAGSAPAAFTVTNAADQATVTAQLTGIGLTKTGAGTLLINNAATSIGPVVVSAGTLSGVFTTTGLTVADGARVRPGTSIGTITSTGPVDFQTGSRLDVDITSGGMSDRIAVTGTANVAAGTTLGLSQLDTARLVLGTRYTIISTTGGRTGSFATLAGNTRVSRFISVVQETDPNNLYLAVRQTSSFASAGATRNQIAAGAGVDSPGNGALYNTIAYLDTDAQARTAFDQLSGELHATARGASAQDSRFVREAIQAHTAGLADERMGLWFAGYGSWGNTQGDGNAQKVSREIGGFFIGYDLVKSDNLSLGVLAGYGTAVIDVDQNPAQLRGRATTDDLHLAGYAAFRAGKLVTTAGLATMQRKMNTRRTAQFPGFSDSLSAAYDTNVSQGFVEVAFQLPYQSLALEPYAQAAYVSVSTDRIAERGGQARLRSEKANDGFLVTTLGARVKYGLPVGNGKWGAVLDAGYRRFGGGRSTTPIDFAFPSGPLFSIAGTDFGRDVAALGAAVMGQVAPNVTVDVGYRGQLGAEVKDHGLRGSVVVAF
jgi:outer membrane autotransporter protein